MPEEVTIEVSGVYRYRDQPLLAVPALKLCSNEDVTLRGDESALSIGTEDGAQSEQCYSPIYSENTMSA